MAKICPRCGRENSDTAQMCTFCAATISDVEISENKSENSSYNPANPTNSTYTTTSANSTNAQLSRISAVITFLSWLFIVNGIGVGLLITIPIGNGAEFFGVLLGAFGGWFVGTVTLIIPKLLIIIAKNTANIFFMSEFL